MGTLRPELTYSHIPQSRNPGFYIMSVDLNVDNEFLEIFKTYCGLNKMMPVKKKASNSEENGPNI